MVSAGVMAPVLLMPALLLLLQVIAGSAGNNLEGCVDPPGNNGIADVAVSALEGSRNIMLTGVPSLHIPPLDPMGPLPSIPFDVNTEALVVKGSVNETTVRNLAQFIICQLNVSVGLKQKFAVEFRMDNFHVDGLYEMNGLALSLFPIFGDGIYTLDTYNAGFKGSATASYNVFTDIITISDLSLDVFFEELKLVMECVLGCGDMADIVNKYLSEIGTSIFNAVWNAMSPLLSDGIEKIVNKALKNYTLSDFHPRSPVTNRDLGNANHYVDLVLRTTRVAIEALGLDPAPLPNTTLHINGVINADLVNGSMSGLSTLRRSGTATMDKVVDWNFLYANIALGPLKATYPGVAVNKEGISDSFEAILSLEVVDIYITARGNTFNGIMDLDQFVISDLGPVDVKIHGLGLLGWLSGPLSDAILNLFLDDLQTMISTQLKDAIQNALNETPWPGI